MPSCTRFAAFAIVFGSAGYLLLFALAELVEPRPREIVADVAVHLRAVDTVSARARSSKPASEHVSFYQSLQAFPLSR